MENFVETFPASWKILEAFSCALKKDPAVYEKLKNVEAFGENFEKNSCAIQIKKQSKNSI